MTEIVILKIHDDDVVIMDKILAAFSNETVEKIEVTSPQNILLFSGLKINLQTHSIHRDNAEISLTMYEYQVLCYLARHAGWICTKQQIFEAVWRENADISYHVVETIIYQIRRKIEPDPSNPLYIQTVIGHGYKFVGSKDRQL